MLQFALPLLALSASLASKPCTESPRQIPDSLLAKATVAKGIAGAGRVALDPSGSCIEIDVNSPGTKRLVKLLLRTLEVPSRAVRFQVVS
jgi:hypothetical protein